MATILKLDISGVYIVSNVTVDWRTTPFNIRDTGFHRFGEFNREKERFATACRNKLGSVMGRVVPI